MTWVEDPNAVQGLSASPTQRVEIQTIDSIAGLFAPPNETSTLAPPSSLTTGDFDEDDVHDPVVGHATGGVSIALNNGDDTFATPTVVVSDTGTDFGGSAELDGDGYRDLPVIDGAGVLSVLLGGLAFNLPGGWACQRRALRVDAMRAVPCSTSPRSLQES